MNYLLAADSNLQRITDTVVTRFAPRRVILFGSHARDEARSGSDYDIMVELEDGADTRASRESIYSAIRSRGPWVDVIVRTAARFSALQDDPGCLDWDIAREGTILYERNDVPPFRRPDNRVSEPEGGWPSFAGWLRRADEDYRVLENILGADAPAWSAVAFHAHQSAEKLLKACLLRAGIRPPRSHLLSDVLGAIPNPPDSERLSAACAVLQQYYPRARYPDDDDEDRPLTEAEARDAASAARLVRDVLLPLVGADA